MKEIDKANLELYKNNSEEYEKLRSDLRRILKFIKTDDLINELKKRKLLKFNWINNKYEEQKDEKLVSKLDWRMKK